MSIKKQDKFIAENEVKKYEKNVHTRDIYCQ